MSTDSVSEMALKAGVPVAVSGLTVFGVTLPEVVQLLTGIYVLLMAVDKAWSLYSKFREKKKETNGDS